MGSLVQLKISLAEANDFLMNTQADDLLLLCADVQLLLFIELFVSCLVSFESFFSHSLKHACTSSTFFMAILNGAAFLALMESTLF